MQGQSTDIDLFKQTVMSLTAIPHKKYEIKNMSHAP